jgi:hypothetical protein
MGTFESRASLLPVSISGISPGRPSSHEDDPFPSQRFTDVTFNMGLSIDL